MNEVVFFYGGLMNPRMFERLGVKRRIQSSATLVDYELTISPWVNIRPCKDAEVYGVLMEMSEYELDLIYAQLMVRYKPIRVDVASDGNWTDVLCYVAAEPMEPSQAEEGHVRLLLEAAELKGFPAHYLEHIRSYLPRA